jgi:hypothetical protein
MASLRGLCKQFEQGSTIAAIGPALRIPMQRTAQGLAVVQ